MKSDWFIIKKIHGNSIFALRLSLLRGCLCVCMTLLLISCASVPKNKTYLNTTSLSGISKVKVLVSANASAVKSSRNSTSMLDALFPLPAMAARSLEDYKASARIREHEDFIRLEENMAQSFMQPLLTVTTFKTIDYLEDKNQNNLQSSNVNYDAVIRLSVRDISIRTVAGDYVKIHALVHGQMENLHSGVILWDREEYISSSEPQPISFYKEHGLKDLPGMLQKAAERLSNDFIYR